jgi:MarR family protein
MMSTAHARQYRDPLADRHLARRTAHHRIGRVDHNHGNRELRPQLRPQPGDQPGADSGSSRRGRGHAPSSAGPPSTPAALDAQLRCDAGISHFEYQVLALLSEAPGRTLRMSELATMAEGSLPRLSQVVARMEQRGWVRRTPDPADGRYTLAILTDQARRR